VNPVPVAAVMACRGRRRGREGHGAVEALGDVRQVLDGDAVTGTGRSNHDVGPAGSRAPRGNAAGLLFRRNMRTARRKAFPGTGGATGVLTAAVIDTGS
jgi:hypothetical protein